MASSLNTININTDKQRKRRKNLSLEDKIDIIRRKDTDVKLSDERLAIEFGVKWHSSEQGEISTDAKYSDLKKTRIQAARFRSLEEALYAVRIFQLPKI